MKTVSFVFAIAENNVIARKGKLPWHLPTDIAHFRGLIRHHSAIMGRTTFELLKQPFADVQNIVVTDVRDYEAPGAEVAHSIEEAITLAHDDEVFVIGGAKTFESAFAYAQKLYVTQIHAVIEGDTFLHLDYSHWLEESREEHQADDQNEYDFTFVTYVRP